MKYYFAPLHGVGRQLFRKIHHGLFGGYDRYFSPFIGTVSARSVARSHLKDIDPLHSQVPGLIPQIIGNDPLLMIRLIEAIADLGYDEVNWNLGCPFKTVANKQRGSGLLPFPEKIDRILDTVFSKINIRFSIKTRLGRKKAEEFDPLVEVFNRYPLSELIVHSRIGIQMYQGKPDCEAFAEYYGRVKNPLIYNGDICSEEHVSHLIQRFPSLKAVMIGRAAVGIPHLILELRGQALNQEDKKAGLMEYHDLLLENYSRILYGPGHLLDKMKEIWSYLQMSISGGQALYKKIQRVMTLEAYHQQVKEIFGSAKIK